MKRIIISIIIITLLLETMPIAIGNAQSLVNKEPITNNPVEYWGITISTIGEGEYENLALVFRDILCENGWKKDHIKALAGYDATLQNVVDALIWLADNSDANDRVLFHHIGHGSSDSFILNYNSMQYSTLDQYLDNVLYEGLVIILNGCYSGSAIQYLEQEGRVILTATDADHTAAGHYFSTFCSIGLQGFADFEGNNNLWNSAEETYDFVKNDTAELNPPYHIPPQISDSYSGELDLTYFNYLNWPGLLDQYAVHKAGGCLPMADDFWWAQSFVPTYPVLSAVMLNIQIREGNPGLLTVSIKEDLYGDELCSLSLEQDNFYRCGTKFYVFDLPDINVMPGEKYWIVMKPSEPSGKYAFLAADANDSYPAGELAFSTNHGASWDLYGSYSADLYFVSLGRPIDDPPLKPNTPSGSVTGFPDILYTYSTSAIDPESDQIYYKWDWGDDNFSDWLGPFDSGENAESTYSWRAGGTYKIRVKAKDPYCAESEWSDGLDISIMNDPPNPPIISGQISGKVGEEYDYTFVSIDLDGDDIASYTIDWDDDSGFEVVEGPFDSGQIITVSHTWDEQGTYTIKAKAKDIHYAESDWGTLSVTMPLDLQSSQHSSTTPQSQPSDQQVSQQINQLLQMIPKTATR